MSRISSVKFKIHGIRPCTEFNHTNRFGLRICIQKRNNMPFLQLVTMRKRKLKFQCYPFPTSIAHIIASWIKYKPKTERTHLFPRLINYWEIRCFACIFYYRSHPIDAMSRNTEFTPRPQNIFRQCMQGLTANIHKIFSFNTTECFGLLAHHHFDGGEKTIKLTRRCLDKEWVGQRTLSEIGNWSFSGDCWNSYAWLFDLYTKYYLVYSYWSISLFER